jgi:DNA-binding beta-propeller fold protein YncE
LQKAERSGCGQYIENAWNFEANDGANHGSAFPMFLYAATKVGSIFSMSTGSRVSWSREYVADRENHRVQVFDGNGRYQGQWNNLARPCGLFVARGKSPLAFIGELGPETAATLTQGVPNIGPRVSIVSSKGEVLTHLGTEPLGEGVGQFIAPHGIAVDSRGDIYVAEVSNTYWAILYGKKPDHELRSFQKLVKVN